MCRRATERLDHLFLHCDVAISMWTSLFQLIGIYWVPPACCVDLLIIDFCGFVRSSRGVVFWRCVVLAIFLGFVVRKKCEGF